MTLTFACFVTLASSCATATPLDSVDRIQASKGVAVAYPWTFDSDSTQTAHKQALDSAAEIAQKAGYAAVSGEEAQQAWSAAGMQAPSGLPTLSQLRRFAAQTKASKILYGSASWHTRSIWVGAGPKTISTATVSAYVYDAKANKVVYRKSGVQARSDEKENGLKVAGAVLISPLVTAVSGGPAAPREQRAVQIALARAYQGWIGRKG